MFPGIDDPNDLNSNLTELIKAAAAAASSKEQQLSLLHSLSSLNNMKPEGLTINNYEKRKSISNCNNTGNLDSYHQSYLEQSSNHSNESLKHHNSSSNNSSNNEKTLNIQIPNSPTHSSAASSPITSSSLSPNPSNTSL
jgi:hypothetical protein